MEEALLAQGGEGMEPGQGDGTRSPRHPRSSGPNSRSRDAPSAVALDAAEEPRGTDSAWGGFPSA